MSFLKQYISNEGFVLGLEDDTVTVDDEVQVAEAMGEANAVRQEIENTADDIEKADAVANELELQNDAMAGMAEENGGAIPEQAAAGFELARRAAVAAVGVDPDSEEGEEAVDAAGLESYVKGLISLEEAQEKNKGFLQKIKDSIKAAWNWIVEKIKAFTRWVSKITNILPKKYRAAYNAIKELSDDAFDRGLTSVLSSPEQREKLLRLIVNGKIADISDVSDAVGKFVKGCDLGYIAAIKFTYNFARGQAGDDGVTEDKEEFQRKALLQIVESVRKHVGDTVVVNGSEYRLSMKGANIDFEVKDVVGKSDPKFSRKDMLDALNQGLISEKLYERATKAVEDIEKNGEVKKFADKGLDKSNGKYAQKVFTYISKVTGQAIKLHHELTAHRNNLVSMAKIIATEANRKEDKKENN